MPISVTATTHGAAALDALAAAVRAAKADAGDPLAPVTVVVPNNTVGVMARRALGRRGGAAAIEVLTLFRVAEIIGAPLLREEGRRPVSTPVVDLAVKQVLAEAPGRYGRVDRHPSTVVALRDVYRELRVAGPRSLAALARTRRGAEPARVVNEVAARLTTGWYDESDLLTRAAAHVRIGAPRRFARVVVFLPERVRALEQALLAALGEQGAIDLVVAMSGDSGADRSIRRLVSELTGRAVPAPAAVTTEPPPKVEVVSTTDADDEVRLAVRSVVDAARRGVRFDRMAILWPTDRPYARIVEHQLDAAGVPWNGRPGTLTAERMVPRVLADLLELDRRGLRRSNVMTLLGDVPARDRSGTPVPTARWERIGRRAGIVREPDWDRGLDLARADAAERRPWDLDAVESLGALVGDLRQALGDPAERRPWSGWVRWCHERLDQWFTPAGLERLDGDERTAWEQTQRVLDRLDHLDLIGAPPTRPEFRATLMAELEVVPARHGTVGDGVHIGALISAVGLDVDHAVVLGAAEGLLPPPPVVDPLLGEADRDAAGLPGTGERIELAHRHFLAITATTPDVLVTVPRGDLRVASTKHPSRWLDGVPAVVRSMDSHAHALAATEFPVSAAEHRTRDLWTCVRAGVDVRQHPLAGTDPALARAVRTRDARAGDTLTAYDGDLSAMPPPPLTGPISPTQVEQWRECPHAYFVRYLLGVRPIEEPEAIEVLSPLDRGQVIHEAIDRLHQRVLDGDLADPSPCGWTDPHRTALAAVGSEVAAELQAAGRSGRAASWVTERTSILDELDEWLTRDAARWAGRSIRASELSFGGGGDTGVPVSIELSDGRPLLFTGRIDRIDELADGGVVVTDHKTGKADDHLGLAPDDPTLGGTRFQLPVYAAAASTLSWRLPGTSVHAEYAFLRRGRFERVGLTFDDATWQLVRRELDDVVAGIDAGLFPARPAPPEWRRFVRCWFCEPDGLGTAERWNEWERKRHDPRLARWFAEPAEVEGEDAVTSSSTRGAQR
ncbi:MAG: PD-(D/E)XK nuclease family protein [Ilumatobacteraceae bacterium]